MDDVNRGIIAKCQEEDKALYYSEFSLSKDEPCGQYKVIETVTAQGGSDTLTNYIDILCVYALQIDFNKVDWGLITPGVRNVVGGDLVWDDPPDNKPTVKNVGNDGMGLEIRFSEMTGPNKGKIDSFRRLLRHAPLQLSVHRPNRGRHLGGLGDDPAQVLCANDLGKLDLSLHPPLPLVPDTYSGTMDIVAYYVPNKCAGSEPIE